MNPAATPELDAAERPLDLPALADALSGGFAQQVLGRAAMNRVRLRVIDGHAADWHVHDHGVETFFVVRGTFRIDLEAGSVALGEGALYTVAAGLRHRARAEGRVVLLVIDGYDPPPTSPLPPT